MGQGLPAIQFPGNKTVGKHPDSLFRYVGGGGLNLVKPIPVLDKLHLLDVAAKSKLQTVRGSCLQTKTFKQECRYAFLSEEIKLIRTFIALYLLLCQVGLAIICLLGVCQVLVLLLHQRSAVRCSTVHFSTVQCSCNCNTVQFSAVQYSTVQYSTVQYSAVQYSAVKYSTVQTPWNEGMVRALASWLFF